MHYLAVLCIHYIPEGILFTLFIRFTMESDSHAEVWDIDFS